MERWMIVILSISFLEFISGTVFAYDNHGYPYNMASGCTTICTGDNFNFCQNNCTSYAAYMLNQIYGIEKFDNSYLQPTGESWGNGNNWDDAAKRVGISVNKNPIPGDIAYWEKMYDGDQYGHVAFVEKVYYDGSGNAVNIDVTEYNYETLCTFDQRIKISATNPTGFIHILAYNEGVISLHYLDCYETVCLGQTAEEWNWITNEVWNNYRCEGSNCNSIYNSDYIASIASGFGGGTPVSNHLTMTPKPFPDSV